MSNLVRHAVDGVRLLGIALAATAILASARPTCALGGQAAAAQAAPKVAWKRFTVRSPATGKIERFWVGHAEGLKPDGAYPSVYFLDGLLGNEDEWKAALDEPLGRYEMVAVCPSVGGGSWFMNSPAQPWMKWGDFLTDELRAFVEGNYPVSHEKGQRGIVGISAGANAALYHGIKRPELYGAVSVLSGAIELRGYAGQVGLDYWIGPRTAEAMPLYEERSALALVSGHEGPLPFDLCLEAGDKDGALAQTALLRQALDRKQVPYEWNVAPGSHNWTFWKSRTPAQLAWFDKVFAKNRREERFPDKPPATDVAALEVLKGLPDVALSDEAPPASSGRVAGRGRPPHPGKRSSP